MKYKLKQGRFEEFVKKYLDDNYGDLNYTWGLDEDGLETECGVQFYRGDYGDDDTVFWLYNKCWWNRGDSGIYSVAKELWNKSPLVVFENKSDYNALNNYFGDQWKPIFIVWFKKTYDFKIKNVES